MNSVGVPIGKVTGSGIVTKAVKPVVIENQEELSRSEKPEFNKDTVQDIRTTEKVEGGISAARSTGITGMSNEAPKTSVHAFQDYKENKFELSGFSASYTLPGTKDIVSQEIRVFFDDIESAKESVKNGKYYHKHGDEIIEMNITLGSPIICANEIQRLMQVDGEWRRP